jgi:OmpA-OmpF porin, OOP family
MSTIKQSHVKHFNTIALAAAIALSFTARAQDAPATGTNSGTSASGATDTKIRWTVGISGAVIDDDGEPFKNLFNVSDSWHFLPFPSRLHVDAAINKNWSFEGALTFSKYQAGKIVNNDTITEDKGFFSFDAHAKYHFIGAPKVFDPYAVAGLGFTQRKALLFQTPTLNVGIGFNIWFIESFGMNLQSTVKLKMNSKSSSYMLHSAGLIYRFN